MHKSENLEISLSPILLEAIKNGRKDEVANLIKEQPLLLNTVLDKNKGFTPLGHAIRGNHKDIVEILLSFDCISLDTGDCLYPEAESFADFWQRKEIVQLIKNFKMKKKDKNLGLDLNTQRIIPSPHQSVELNNEPNIQYAYDDEDINNRVNAEIFQQGSELVYYTYDTVSKIFSGSITNPNQQKTNFLIDLKKQWQIIIAPAVSNALSDIEAVLQPIVKQIGVYIDWVKTQPHASNLIGIRLLFPYKLDVWHWNLGEINMILDENKAIISCVGISHDPFGNGNIESALKEQLKKLLQSITHASNIDLNQVSQFQLARQKGRVYCGIVAARDLLRRIDDLPLDDAEYCTIYNNETDVRMEDLEIFREYLDEERFKRFLLKQKENNFDHYISTSQLQTQQSQISEDDEHAVSQLISKVKALNLSANLLQSFVSFFQNQRELEFSDYSIELKNNLISFKDKLQDKQLESYQSLLQNLFGAELKDRNETLIKPEVINAFYNCMISEIDSMQTKSPVTSIKPEGDKLKIHNIFIDSKVESQSIVKPQPINTPENKRMKKFYPAAGTVDTCKWNSTSFDSFLRLMIVTNNKASEIDCKFENIDVKTLKELLISVTRNCTDENKILIVRLVSDQLCAFLLSLKECQKNNIKTKKYVIECFSADISIDTQSNTSCQSFEKSIAKINSDQRSRSPVMQLLLSEDFLGKTDLTFKFTDLIFYSVQTDKQFSETLLAFKLCSVLEVEAGLVDSKSGVIGGVELLKLHNKYISLSQQKFIKSSSVAKAQQGFAYQEHLIMLLAYLAMKDVKKSNFVLIAEGMVPEAWNDVIFEWGDDLIFFQQKHRSDYSSSVEESYSTTEMLCKEWKQEDDDEEERKNKRGKGKKDASILKYYRAFQGVAARINNPQDVLNIYKNKLKTKNIKFVFFTNRFFPICEETEKLKDNSNVEFKLVPRNNIPLIGLEGFSEIIENRKIWQLKRLDANEIGLGPNEQEGLNEFLDLFYIFHKQKDAGELSWHCKEIIQSPHEGYSQAYIADLFSRYINLYFITENPEKHSFDRLAIKNFFDNGERFFNNLLKYSSHDNKIDGLPQLLKSHVSNIKNLPSLIRIKDTIDKESNITIYAQNVYVALELIKLLLPSGERQILTPCVLDLDKYEVSDKHKYFVLLGEENELCDVVNKIKNSVNYGKTKIIQLKDSESNPDPQLTMSLITQVKEIDFLSNEGVIGILDDSLSLCLTDLLSLALKVKQNDEFSEEEKSIYVEQRLSKETIILPYDELEKALSGYVRKNKECAKSWKEEKGSNKHVLRQQIEILLPEYLSDKSIQLPSNNKFKFQEKKLYFVFSEMDYIPPPEYPHEQEFENIDFEKLGLEISTWVENDKKFGETYNKTLGYPNTEKRVLVKLKIKCDADVNLPTKWDYSTNKKSLFFALYDRSVPLKLKLNNFFSEKTISVIEAEAACGKTWHLRSKIKKENLLENKKIPILIKLKDLEKVKDQADKLTAIINGSSLHDYIKRLFMHDTKYFNFLLDGYDELKTEHKDVFEEFLKDLLSKNCSITITVRDYQIKSLQSKTIGIIVQQKLEKFNREEIKKCLELSVKKNKEWQDKDNELTKLCDWITAQSQLSEWLGIPFHVALISEWYINIRESFLAAKNPTTAELYNFIVQNRIARATNKNGGHVYKILNKLAWQQIFGAKDASNIFPLSDKKYKSGLNFDLERTGLLKEPFSETSDLCHKTFAEFLVAKRILNKVIGKTSINDGIFLKVVEVLYQEDYKLICHFFMSLFKCHRNLDDFPYELTTVQEAEFKGKWLVDVLGVELGAKIPNKKMVVWDITKNDDLNSKGKGEENDASLLDGLPKELDDFKKNLQLIIHQEDILVLDKHGHRDLIVNGFKLYNKIESKDGNEKIEFYKLLRQANIRIFLREDYPSQQKSLYKKYLDIDDIDVHRINQLFVETNDISSKYSWNKNNNSHAFKCWSDGGYKDVDFAMPVFEAAGPNLNIVHVYYMLLYLKYGGYSKDNHKRIIDIAMKAVKDINETTDSKRFFCCILLFLGIIDNWKDSQEHPTLSISIAEKIIKCFQNILDKIDINAGTKLFTNILLVRFLKYFQIRCYIDYSEPIVSNLVTIKLIFSDGVTAINLKVDSKVIEKALYAEINKYHTQKSESSIEKFQNCFLIKEKLSYRATEFFLPGLMCQRVLREGRCLFAAVELCLGERQGFLRERITENKERSMEQCREVIKNFDPVKSFKHYLENLRRGIKWEDDLEIAVLMKILDCSIVVVNPDGRIINLSNLIVEEDYIFVQYNSNNHYDALILTREKDSKEIFEVLAPDLNKHSQESEAQYRPSLKRTHEEPTKINTEVIQKKQCMTRRHSLPPLIFSASNVSKTVNFMSDDQNVAVLKRTHEESTKINTEVIQKRLRLM